MIQLLTNSNLKSRTSIHSSILSEVDEQLRYVKPPIPTGFEAKLPWMAGKLHISSDISDYFFRATPIIISDLPNRNGVAFPINSLTEWNTDLHTQAYEGWRYCPMFEEHASEDIRGSVGVISDITLRKLKGYAKDRLWLAIILSAIDRSKNTYLTRAYESGEVNTVSMGAWVDGWTCSYCGAAEEKCHHIDADPKKVTFYELNGKLVFKNVWGVSPYETSLVKDPAYGIAIGSDRKLIYT